uniref:testis-specific gene A8 protein-like n=1 Tax=Myodes glareolus TaxID=447135 RepID=UPI002021F7A7|nr:testis-specific gene A8 protein-like [Myodes glareolus]
MDLPSSTSDVPMVANGSFLMVKTKAAYKQYPPSILYGKGLKTSKRGKRATKKTIRKRDGDEAAAPEPKKIKESLVTEMPQPLAEQPEKPAEEQATEKPAEEQATEEPSEPVAAAADEGGSQ